MTATLAAPVVTEPGLYDLTDEQYHADPVPEGSLSASGAKLLLPPNCPALFKYRRDNPEQHKAVFDFGKAAHLKVLGAGPEVVVVDAPDWRTKAAQQQRKDAYAAGAVPMLAADYARVDGMAAALTAHPIARALFDPDHGRPEQSLFWRDHLTSVMRRARFDWLPHDLSTVGRLVIPDYKTCDRADLESIQMAVHRYRYYIQAAAYIDGAVARIAEDAAFVFVFQEKTAPYLINVVELDPLALQRGRALNRQALDIFARCNETGEWPGYSDDVETVRLPAWVEKQIEDGWL